MKHGDAIADLAELVELVRDIEDADSPVPDLPHYLEENFALGVGHAGGRFVEYDDLGIGNARLRRRDDEPLRVPELGHQGFGRYRYPEAREEGFAVLVELVAVERASDGSSAARYATEEDVFRDAQVVEKLGVLVLHHYPRAPRFIYGPEIDHAAVEEYLSRVAAEDAADQVHESSLAGAVLADEHVDIAGDELQRDILEGEIVAEVLAYRPKLDEWRSHP